MNDDCISESLYCCTEQSKAYSIQEKVMLEHKAILSLNQVHEGVSFRIIRKVTFNTASFLNNLFRTGQGCILGPKIE